MLQSGEQHHDHTEITLATQEAYRGRCASTAATIHRTAETQAVIVCLTEELSRHPTWLTRVAGLVQLTATGTSLCTDDLSQLLVDFKKLLVTAGTAAKGVTPWSGSRFSLSLNERTASADNFQVIRGASLLSCKECDQDLTKSLR
jgi:hypothetical protein